MVAVRRITAQLTNKKKSTSACWVRAECNGDDVAHIREKMQREDEHMKYSRTSKGGIVKEAHTTNITYTAFWRPSEKRTKQRNRKMCSTSRTMANGSDKKLSSTAVLLSV